MSNQAWTITSPSTLTLTTYELPPPSPGPNQLLLRIHAVALNYRDHLVLTNSPFYPQIAAPNLVPCTDASAEILAIGPSSPATASSSLKWTVGDRVLLFPNTWLSGDDERGLNMRLTAGANDRDGFLRRYVVWDADRVVRLPVGLSWEEGAACYTAGITAFRGLGLGGRGDPSGEVKKGSKVLVQGTGGVSCFVIQFAAAVGAEIVVISSSTEKLEVARRLGGKHLINYKEIPDWEHEVLRMTDGTGVDLTVDVVGADSIKKTLKATRVGGTIALVGILSQQPNLPVDIMTDIFYGAKKLRGQLSGSRDNVIQMMRFMETHNIHPQLAKVYEWEEADKAMNAAVHLTEPGKVVIRV